MNEMIENNLKKLSKDERRAVVAMLILMLTENLKRDSNINVIGDLPGKLDMWYCDDRRKREICEQLVARGVFCRHCDSDAALDDTTNSPVAEDNWYSFSREIVLSADTDIFGEFLLEFESRELSIHRGKFYTAAVDNLFALSLGG